MHGMIDEYVVMMAPKHTFEEFCKAFHDVGIDVQVDALDRIMMIMLTDEQARSLMVSPAVLLALPKKSVRITHA